MTAKSKVRTLLDCLFINRRGHFNPVLPFVFCFHPSGKIISQKFFLKFLSLLSGKDVAAIRKNKRYQYWLRQYASRKKSVLQAALSYQPTISILVPVYNTPVIFLHEMVESVKNQIYPNWELCIADDCSTNKETRDYLEELSAQADPRIRVCFRKTNGHICESSNSALELATGEFCALLDHDDVLTTDALIEVVYLLNKTPDCDFVYSDEDKTDGAGNFSEPNFKPVWSPDNLLSRNYPGHLSIFKTSLIKEVGGFEKGMEGSQDYDLYLKLTEKARNIQHIPKLLYRWRKHEGSVAMNAGSKPYAYIAAERALASALKRRGEEGTVVPLENDMLGFYSIRYSVSSIKKVSIIIVSENTQTLRRKVASLLDTCTYPDFEVLVIHSPDSGEFPESTERLRFLSCNEKSLAGKLNFGVVHAFGSYILVLDPETSATSNDWLHGLVEQVQRPSIGVAGAKLIYPNQSVYHAGLIFNEEGLPISAFENYPAFLHHKLIHTINNYPMVSGACMMFRKALFQQLNGFEAECGDGLSTEDFCLKALQKGFYNVYLPHVELGYKGKSRQPDTQEKALFAQKWKSISSFYLQHSRCYNSEFIY